MNNGNLITAVNVSKVYEKDSIQIPVLKDLSFEIQKGEFVVVKGPSGAGKSTLLNLLGALDSPTEGQILIDNKDISKFSEKDQALFRNKFIGFVFQFHHLLVEFTALENVFLPAMISKGNFEEIKEKASTILDQVGLSHRKTHKPRELSGGEQQRIAIARALMNSPQLILADEPTGNLDTRTSDKIFDLLNQLNRDYKQTFIVATHSEILAQSANRIIEIIDGQIVDNRTT